MVTKTYFASIGGREYMYVINKMIISEFSRIKGDEEWIHLFTTSQGEGYNKRLNEIMKILK
jgi:pyruvate formate-lyase activating enzyme-like uncharacterized protein